ncbi:protein-export chaperone SecB [Geotalea uraniireducens]|uniref:Protein translocase subunit secB n=1 Tax=Geotalea uraniireducens (strain Rf4) TaxID=351605 RepID=A5G9X8_GEOUR|nr:protein-export chaperone SecB [Geotalea uraniireducens]ABQ25610.1 protein translocase subunit secB [Geotalea uraniireducens Rf4]
MANENYEFQFIDFRIVSSNFNIKLEKEFDSSKLTETAVNFAMKHDFVAESKKLQLFMKVDIGGADLPFTLSIEGGALFAFSHPIDDTNAFRKIAEINCAAIAFPYLREAVADIIRRGGYPPLHLPSVNFVDMYKRNHPEEVQA